MLRQACIALALCASARGQELGTVVVDDSPSALQALRQAEALAPTNPAEAARLCAEILRDAGTKLVRSGADPDLFVPATVRTVAFVREHPAVLEQLRERTAPQGRRLLDGGRLEEAAGGSILAEPGLLAAMALAEAELRQASGAAALARLESCVDHPDRARHEARWRTLRAMAAWASGQTGKAKEDLEVLQSMQGEEAAAAMLRRMLERPPPGAQAVEEALGPGAFGDGLLPQTRVVWKIDLVGSLAARAAGALALTQGPEIDPRAGGALLTSIPTMLPGQALVDDGQAVLGFRPDLGVPLWSAGSGPWRDPRIESGVGDLNEVVVIGDRALALTGHASVSERAGGGRLVCVDRSRGGLLWDATPPRGIDRADGDWFFHGSPAVADGIVAVLARKVSTRSEFSSCLFAYSLGDGRPMWSVPLGASSGVRGQRLPPFSTPRSFSTPLVEGGDAFVTSALGVTARIRMADGVVRWLRRGLAPVREVRYGAFPFEVARPVLVAGRLLVLSSDETAVDVIDPGTGAMVHRVPIGAGEPCGVPRYLLAAPGSNLVAAVGSDLVVLDAPELAVARWSLSALDPSLAADPMERSGLRGRVQVGVLSDGRAALLVPTANAVTLRVMESGDSLGTVPLDGPKNPVLRNGTMMASLDSALVAATAPSAALAALDARLAEAIPEPGAAEACAAFADATGDAGVLLERIELVERALSSDADGAARQRVLEVLLALGGEDDPSTRARLLAAAERIAVEPSQRARVLLRQAAVAIDAGDEGAARHAVARILAEEGIGACWIADGERQARATVLALDLARTHGGTGTAAKARLRAAAEHAAAGNIRAAIAEAWDAAAIAPGPDERCEALLVAAGYAGSAGWERMRADLLSEAKAAAEGAAGQAAARVSQAFEQDPLLNRSAALPVIEGSPGAPIEIDGRIPLLSDLAQSERPVDAVLVALKGTLSLLDPTRLVPKWSHACRDPDPEILRFSSRSLVFWESDVFNRPILTSLDPGTGDAQWSIPNAGDLFAAPPLEIDGPDARIGLVGRIEALPSEEDVLLVRSDGALVSVGIRDGLPRWSTPACLLETTAIAQDESMLALAGRESAEGPPVIRLLDRSTGATLGSIGLGGDSPVEWLAPFPGVLVYGDALGVGGIRLGIAPQEAWRDGQSLGTQGGVPRLGLLLLLGADGGVRALWPASGRVLPGFDAPALPAQFGRRERAGIVAIGMDTLLVQAGELLLFDSSGALRGRDAVSEEQEFRGVILASPDCLGIAAVTGPLRPVQAAPGVRMRLWRIEPAHGLRASGAPLEISLAGAFYRGIAVPGWVLLSSPASTTAIPFRSGGA